MNEDTALDLEFAITELEPRQDPAPIANFGSGGGSGGHFGGSGGRFGGSGGGSGT
jgi:hypothetical protein